MIGVLYLDTKTTPKYTEPGSDIGKFTEDHLALAIAVAHQAALAVEETYYHQAMVQAERLAAIGQTIAALSHHIKNILQGLRSGNEILKMGLKDKNDNLVQQGYRISEKNQAKIYDLVMDMLSYSKERIPAVEECDLNDVVKDIHDLLAPRAQELNVQFDMTLAEHLPRVQVDPEGIHRALLNIVGNAIDAVEDRPSPRVTIGTRLAEEGWVRIVVADNGAGIAHEHGQEIFKHLVSTKGPRGTGLGLPVSRKMQRARRRPPRAKSGGRRQQVHLEVADKEHSCRRAECHVRGPRNHAAGGGLRVSMSFKISITEDADRQLRPLPVREQRILEAAIQSRLEHEPKKRSKAIKRLRTNPLAEFELRAGDVRALYNVEGEEVVILIVGRKVGNKLIVEGEEFHGHQDIPLSRLETDLKKRSMPNRGNRSRRCLINDSGTSYWIRGKMSPDGRVACVQSKFQALWPNPRQVLASLTTATGLTNGN